MARCHRIEEAGGRLGWITEQEYPGDLLTLESSEPARLAFDEQIDWYRQLVLESEVIAVKRHVGGELGIEVRGRQKYDDVRHALVGFVTPIDLDVADALGRIGYTSLLRDGKRAHVLYGPLALVQHRSSGVRLGTVQRGFDWVYSVGPILEETMLIRNIKWIRMKASLKGAERGQGKTEYSDKEEVFLDYGGGGGSDATTAGEMSAGGQHAVATRPAEEGVDAVLAVSSVASTETRVRPELSGESVGSSGEKPKRRRLGKDSGGEGPPDPGSAQATGGEVVLRGRQPGARKRKASAGSGENVVVVDDDGVEGDGVGDVEGEDVA